MALPAWMQRLMTGGPLGGTGGINPSYPPRWSTPPFFPTTGPQTSNTPSNAQLIPTYGKNVPPWLQKLSGGFNSVMNRFGGPADPNLTAQENDARQQQARMAMIGQLLQANAP